MPLALAPPPMKVLSSMSKPHPLSIIRLHTSALANDGTRRDAGALVAVGKGGDLIDTARAADLVFVGLAASAAEHLGEPPADE